MSHMWPNATERMRLLFVHERLGSFAGAEANILATADELKRRGHTIGLVYGPAMGRTGGAWDQTFSYRFALGHDGNALGAAAALEQFRPDAVYVHKTADLDVLSTLAESGLPLVRMVLDRNVCCQRTYQNHYCRTRRICEHSAAPFSAFPPDPIAMR